MPSNCSVPPTQYPARRVPNRHGVLVDFWEVDEGIDKIKRDVKDD
jgi:hypothetical protein